MPSPDLLTDDEINALLEYSGPGYREMNPELRGFTHEGGERVPVTLDRTEADAERLAAAMRGLNKLPVHDGVVFRGTQMDAGELERYSVGAVVVQSRKFISASKSLETAEAFRKGGNVMMQISSSAGRNFEQLSLLGIEREVLFNYASKFRVDAVHQIGSVTWLHVTEI